MEIYAGAHRRLKPLTPKEIKKLKDNMARAPLIHKESEEEHKTQAAKADELLQQALEKTLAEPLKQPLP